MRDFSLLGRLSASLRVSSKMQCKVHLGLLDSRASKLFSLGYVHLSETLIVFILLSYRCFSLHLTIDVIPEFYSLLLWCSDLLRAGKNVFPLNLLISEVDLFLFFLYPPLSLPPSNLL